MVNLKKIALMKYLSKINDNKTDDIIKTIFDDQFIANITKEQYEIFKAGFCLGMLNSIAANLVSDKKK